MKKKLLPFINEVYIKCLDGTNYRELILNKFKRKDYEEWLKKTCGQKIGNSTLLNDTTSQCASFTAFCTSKSSFGNMSIVDFYYIQKSVISDLFIVYVKSKVVMRYSSGNIIYPETLIISPESIYKTFFSEAHKLITNHYPNARFVSFSILKKDFSLEPSEFLDHRSNYYGVLFGYEGDITKLNMIGEHHFRFQV